MRTQETVNILFSLFIIAAILTIIGLSSIIIESNKFDQLLYEIKEDHEKRNK